MFFFPWKRTFIGGVPSMVTWCVEVLLTNPPYSSDHKAGLWWWRRIGMTVFLGMMCSETYLLVRTQIDSPCYFWRLRPGFRRIPLKCGIQYRKSCALADNWPNVLRCLTKEGECVEIMGWDDQLFNRKIHHCVARGLSVFFWGVETLQTFQKKFLM